MPLSYISLPKLLFKHLPPSLYYIQNQTTLLSLYYIHIVDLATTIHRDSDLHITISCLNTHLSSLLNQILNTEIRSCSVYRVSPQYWKQKQARVLLSKSVVELWLASMTMIYFLVLVDVYG